MLQARAETLKNTFAWNRLHFAFNNFPAPPLRLLQPRALDTGVSRAVEFRNQHRLGIYKKARLGNTFRWELTELGYSKPFVETATEGLVVYISRKTAESAKRGG